jgi:hypothetical protein
MAPRSFRAHRPELRTNRHEHRGPDEPLDLDLRKPGLSKQRTGIPVRVAALEEPAPRSKHESLDPAESTSRIGRGVLDTDEPSLGLQHPPRFLQRDGGVPHRAEHEAADHGIDRVVLEIETLRAGASAIPTTTATTNVPSRVRPLRNDSGSNQEASARLPSGIVPMSVNCITAATASVNFSPIRPCHDATMGASSANAELGVRQVGKSLSGGVYRTRVTRPLAPEYFTL